jgi:hypothetical protein
MWFPEGFENTPFNINLFYNTLSPSDMGLLVVQTLQICSFEFEFEINELYTYLY